MPKKIILSSISVLSLMLLFAGCGNKTATTNENSEVKVTAEACEEQVYMGYNCWTSRFPETAYGRSDVSCAFEISCCDVVTEKWTTVYPEAAGLRGVAESGARYLDTICNKAPDKLDLDNDGTPNTTDNAPFAEDIYPWENK